MKNIFRFSALLALCSLVGLSACSHEELSTDQYQDDAVVLGAVAPNPIVRGAELRILGSNLDKIVEVRIPGAEPITDINVVASGRVSEIRVVTPKAGAEDASVTGPVEIVDNAGNTYKTSADLTFTEGIVFDSFSPSSAMPGDEVTVKGDYLYNVQQVVLNNGVYVTGDQIVSKSRRELKFIVPSNAVSGPVTIGDVDENNNPEGLIPNNIPSEETLVIGDPTVKSVARGMLKAGASIKVEGAFLDMIEKVSFKVTTPAAEEGAEDVVAYTDVDFVLADDHKSVTVELPASVADGEVVLTSYAGKEFKAGAYTTVIPTGVAIAAETRYKAGLNAVITGKDLDLVTAADLAGTALEPALVDGKLVFVIPAKAVDGAVTLTLANGKTVSTEAVELVKPVITEVTPLELYAGDESVVVTGEDLDLVVSATLGGAAEEIEYTEDGKLLVGTTVSSLKGKVALTAANGYVVESVEEIKVNYHALVIVNEMPAMQHIGQEVVLKGSNFALVENIFIGETKVTQYSLRTDTEVRFLMPWCKAGAYNMSFHLFSGDVETVATPIEVGLELDIKTIWEGESYVTWSGGAVSNLSWGGYDWSTVKAGTVLTAYFEVVDDGAVIRFGNGSWVALPTTKGFTGADGDGNVSIAKGLTYMAVKLTAADLAELQNNGGLVMCGTGYNISKITLTTEISQEVDLWEGELIADDWASQPYALSDAGLELAAAGAQPGQIVYFYFEQIGADPWKVQIVEGHWGPTYLSVCAVGADTEGGKFTEYDLEANGGKVGLTLTQEMIEAALVQQWWGGTFVLNGDNTKCTKITLL
ncbi:MAG: hypothetical protein IKV91_06610 [Bacteroidales bacterium]|nr:hypothetical protein [Bacteroidales bacterium]